MRRWYNRGMNESIFTKIIRGEIPSHKIYEDERTYAFLTIEPETPGHTLVIPKAQVDKVYEVEDEDYQALWASVKKIAAHMEEVLGVRIAMQVIGIDVPHAHVHLIPMSSDRRTWGSPSRADDAELAEMAKRLAL